MTNVRIGNGTTLGQGDAASPEVFTTIAENISIDPNLEADMIDASNMDTPNGWREFISGLKQMTLAVEGNWLPANATQSATTGGLLDHFVDGDTRNYQLVFPTSPTVTWVLPCKVASLEFNDPNDDKMAFSAELQITGQPTLA